MLIILFLILTVIYYHLKLSIKDGIIIHDPTIATTATNVFFLRDDILEKHSACSFAVFLILLIPRCSVLCLDSIVIITLVFCLYAITVYITVKNINVFQNVRLKYFTIRYDIHSGVYKIFIYMLGGVSITTGNTHYSGDKYVIMRYRRVDTLTEFLTTYIEVIGVKENYVLTITRNKFAQVNL